MMCGCEIPCISISSTLTPSYPHTLIPYPPSFLIPSHPHIFTPHPFSFLVLSHPHPTPLCIVHLSLTSIHFLTPHPSHPHTPSHLTHPHTPSHTSHPHTPHTPSHPHTSSHTFTGKGIVHSQSDAHDNGGTN